MARARTKRPNAIDAHVGSRMRMRRMMLGMSQEKLATAFGVSFQQVQKYERGANRMGSSRLQHAASILRVPVSYFFEDGADGPFELSSPSYSPKIARSRGPWRDFARAAWHVDRVER